jgi:hypothetical protein
MILYRDLQELIYDTDGALSSPLQVLSEAGDEAAPVLQAYLSHPSAFVGLGFLGILDMFASVGDHVRNKSLSLEAESKRDQSLGIVHQQIEMRDAQKRTYDSVLRSARLAWQQVARFYLPEIVGDMFASSEVYSLNYKLEVPPLVVAHPKLMKCLLISESNLIYGGVSRGRIDGRISVGEVQYLEINQDGTGEYSTQWSVLPLDNKAVIIPDELFGSDLVYALQLEE